MLIGTTPKPIPTLDEMLASRLKLNNIDVIMYPLVQRWKRENKNIPPEYDEKLESLPIRITTAS